MAGRTNKLSAEEKIIDGLERFADALESGADVTERFTCRKVILNLEPVEYTPDMVKTVRNTLGVSQSLFAQFLGVSTSAVQKWERGERDVPPVAGRFMDEITNAPDRFRKRFLSLATPAGVS